VKVRIYVEGGPKGAHADGLRRFKNGFKQHLVRLDSRLSTLDVSPCGSTEETIRDYARAVREDGQDCKIALLVDSDALVTAKSPAEHLQAKLNSAKISPDARVNIFLMVQCMEAWLITDVAAVEKCFGPIANAIRFPQNQDIEAVPIRDILASLDAVAKRTPTGHYHKIRDGAKILAELKPEQVGPRSRHARDLHAFLRRAAKA
jgi:hypothetical protein